MQGSESIIIGLIYISTIVYQLINNRILTIVTGNMKRSISIDVHFINLKRDKETHQLIILHIASRTANGNS